MVWVESILTRGPTSSLSTGGLQKHFAMQRASLEIQGLGRGPSVQAHV